MMNLSTFERRPVLCPACGYMFDRATSLEGGRKPEEGDLSICLSCGDLGMFKADGTLTSVTDVAALLAEMEPKTRRNVELSRQFIRARGPIPRRETKQ